MVVRLGLVVLAGLPGWRVRDYRAARRAVRRAISDGLTLRNTLRQVVDLVPFLGRPPEVIYFLDIAAAAEHLALFRLNRPVVVGCRLGDLATVTPPGGWPWSVDDRSRVLHEATRVRSESSAMAQRLESLGIDARKVTIVRPAVDVTVFGPTPAPSSASSRPFRLVADVEGWWTTIVEIALAALGRARAAGIDLRLHLRGEGPEVDRIARTVDALELQSWVVIDPPLRGGERAEWLRTGHAYLATVPERGVDRRGLEAMACALPVIVPAGAGVGETITHDVEGLVFDPLDVSSLLGSIALLAGDRHLCRRLGLAARRRVMGDHAPELEAAACVRMVRAAATTVTQVGEAPGSVAVP